jgi:hypothetical protein
MSLRVAQAPEKIDAQSAELVNELIGARPAHTSGSGFEPGQKG